MRSPRLPNLFLIGAPKCGTTAMSHYLAGHPDIYMSEQAGIKEPYFHCPDLDAPWRISSPAEYEDLFAGAPTGCRYLGEASAAYLYSEHAVPDILTACPQARFIVMLRNPVDLVASLHNQFWKIGAERADLTEAWRLQAARARGEALPPGGFTHGRLHQYGRIASLGWQMERLYRWVDRASVHCIVYDDFNADPAECYRNTLAFLGVGDDGRTAFATLNPSISYRSQRLQRGIVALDRLASRRAAAGGLANALRKLNTRHVKRPTDVVLIEELRAYFSDDVGLLSEILKRDLSSWLMGPSARRSGGASPRHGAIPGQGSVQQVPGVTPHHDRRMLSRPSEPDGSNAVPRESMPSKTIHRKADLAIHGAPPAFDTPLHVGRPNIVNRDAFMRRMGEVLDNQWLTNNGPMVKELERRVAMRLGVRHCVATCNGTTALEIAIRALDLTGEVIVPAWTFVATAHALYWQGITPVFADIDPATHNLDPAAVRRLVTPRTSGIIGVHLWGRAAPVGALQAIADQHGLALMFDAAHAFGSTCRGQAIGGFGRCEVLSFHATKAFNTMEGGAITTNDDELADKLRLMRNFGFAGYDNVVHPGINAKMIEACAAMGLANLDGFDEVVAVNTRNYAAYREALADIPGVTVLDYDPAERNSHHYVVVEVDTRCATPRDGIVAALHAENVLARKYFWPGCHRMQPYASQGAGADGSLAHTEAVADKVIVLPNGPSVDAAAIRTIGQVFAVLAR